MVSRFFTATLEQIFCFGTIKKESHNLGVNSLYSIFSGGMPRASYGDKFTVTVMKGEEKHSVFDLTSKISDFLMITDSTGPCTLMILAEEELTAVDLKAETWPSTHRLPYLNPIHASSITCVHFIHQVRTS